jgi:pyruvate kinase
MKLPVNKTKIICTIGPSSETPEVMESLVLAGMNVARLNFAHGDPDGHRKAIETIRSAAREVGRRVAILADLPGPKLRIGSLTEEKVELKAGDMLILTTENITGDNSRVSVDFDRLPQVLSPGDPIFLNDGFIHLEVIKITGKDVRCRVLTGGELRAHKGVNLPGVSLGAVAFTEQDLGWLRFAKEQDLDAISQSFVESGDDIDAVRKAAEELDYKPFIIAKIERSKALDHIDEILDLSDGIMVARGDLGVEMPIEQIALEQKQLVHKANLRAKPVITATQMLESMTKNLRPTRAEVTDVANAILDGTDCVMLSEESATGSYPVQSVEMLTKIAATIEPRISSYRTSEILEKIDPYGELILRDIIALNVEMTIRRISPVAVIVPTLSGMTARSISRFRPSVWITAVSPKKSTCQQLQFSFGIYPMHESCIPKNWNDYARSWLIDHGIEGNLVILTEGPSARHPKANNRMEIIDLGIKTEE